MEHTGSGKKRAWLTPVLAAAIAGAGLAAACGGDKGDPGEAGPTGSAGPMGTSGPIGATGATGLPGAPGMTGANGSPGTKGAMGDPGTAGTTGPSGSAGPVGSAGPTGSAGPNGNDGPPGTTLSERARVGLQIAADGNIALKVTGLTTTQLERVGSGAYLVNLGGCTDCHNTQQTMGPPLYLGGGTAFDLGGGNVVYARNLTPDLNTGFGLSEAEFIETLRTGKDQKQAGASLIVMPWPVYRWMSDEDLKSIYAYLQVIPPAKNLVTLDMKPMIPPLPFPGKYDEGDVERQLPDEGTPDPDNTVRGYAVQPLADPDFSKLSISDQGLFGRGSYIVNAVAACNDCHTNPARNNMTQKINTAMYLAGGAVFTDPPGLDVFLKQKRAMTADLTGQNNGFYDPFPSFLALITEGKHVLDPGAPPVAWPMPWPAFSHLTREDLQAIYVYITNVPRRTGTNDKVTAEAAYYCTMDSDCPVPNDTCNVAANECVHPTCTGDGDCAACQTCATGKCTPPAAGSMCVTSGI